MNVLEFPVVIDTGQFRTRMGTAANPYPQIIVDTLLYESVNEKHIKINRDVFKNLNLNKSYLGSNSANLENLDLNENFFTINNYVGSVCPFLYTDRIDWNLLETFWTDIITKELYYDTSQLPVLLSEPHNAPFDFQDHTMEFFFESLSIPSFKTMPQELLSFNAIQKNMPNVFPDDSGKGSVGVIVHFGDSSTRILPIASGFLLTEFIGTLNIGGFSVTKSLINKFGPYLESNLTISHSNMNVLKSFGLFDDFISDLIIPPLSEEIISVVKKCPVDYTRSLLGNILFIGGASKNSSLVSKFENYFKALLKRLEINLNEVSINSLGNSTCEKNMKLRSCLTWMGGSYLSRNKDFIEKYFFNRKQYEEYGSCAIRRLSNKDGVYTA